MTDTIREEAGLHPRGFRWFTLVGIGATLIWSGAHILLGSPWAALYLAGMALVFWTCHALHPRIGFRTAQRLSLGNAFIGTLGITVWTGGLGGVTWMWLFLLPVAAALFVGAREAAGWSLGLGIAVIGLGWADLRGLPFPQPFPPEHLQVITAISHGTALLSLVLLSLIYAYLQEGTLGRLRASHSQLKRAHDEVRASEQRLRELIRTIEGMERHVVLVADLQGVISYAGGTGSTFGIPADEVVGRRLETLGEGVRQAALPGSAASFLPDVDDRDHRTVDTAGTRADGSVFPLQISTAPIRNPDRSIKDLVLIGRDRTEEVETQERLIQSSKLASIGELVAGVAHELNNPLTAAMNLSTLLEEELEGDLARDAAEIREQAKRASRIVRGLLSFSRRTPAERVRLDLNELVEDIVEKRRRTAADRGVELKADLRPGLLPLEADPVQLHQVVTNLIQNAEQAIQGAGRNGWVRLQTAGRGEDVRLSVSDNGPGIEPSVLSRIFEPFVTTKGPGEGTGLGLAVSHGIVTAHGGTLKVASEPGGGARFTMTLPGAPQEALGLDPEPETMEPGNEDRIAPLRILVVDDEKPIRRTLARYLSRRGHQVDEAGSGAEALELTTATEYDGVILDMKMPGLSGDEVFRRLEARTPAMAERVIFATGDVVSPDTLEALEATRRPVIEKPYQLEDIARAVEGL